jgi:hypothetical protein
VLHPSARVVVLGDLEVARRTCAVLEGSGYRVSHLLHPTDQELRLALSDDVAAVAVLVRGDVIALRYALLAEHLRPGVRLVATLFDRTVSEQLLRTVPNCLITSPADISVPSIIGASLGGDVLAVDFGDRVLRVGDEYGPLAAPWRAPPRTLRSILHAALGQVRPYDVTTRILLLGLVGLTVILGLDWAVTTAVLHQSPLPAFYAATRVVATVGPGDADRSAPGWYLALSSLLMLLTIGFTALFTAGVVNRLRSSRSIGLVGARTLPRRGHVVVVGLGQVGLRLCTRLRQLGIPVVAVERDPRAVNLRLAKQARVPVLIAHAEDRSVLGRLALDRARALAAMGADDLDNVEVAIAALAVCPRLRIVLRAGEDDVIAETRSLFGIGEVRDVSALTTLAVTLGLTGRPWQVVYSERGQVASFPATGGDIRLGAPQPAPHLRCECIRTAS